MGQFATLKWNNIALASVSQLILASSHIPKGWMFNSPSGHIPRLWVQFPVREWVLFLVQVYMGVNQVMFLFLSLLLSLISINIFKNYFKNK